jgi:hypothetical protein
MRATPNLPSGSSPSSLGLILSPGELEAYLGRFGADRIVQETPTPFQGKVLVRKEKEIALLGGKYSGKSWVARAFLLKGNPDLPNWDLDGNPILVNQSYIYHNSYRATILRRNQIDLDDFVRRFHALVKPYGGRYTNSQFTFPGISEAVISVGHLADKDAWHKYIGVENIRFVLEEAALVPDFSLYEQILTCCRSVCLELRPQLLLTSNAGGPGTGWLIERFYEAKDSNGLVIPANTTITETVPDPYDPTAPPLTTTRIFMFSTMQDNPHAEKDPSYKATMAALKDEKLREAYIHGNWRIFEGTYFDTFRPKGPNLAEGEPPWANHVIPPPGPTSPTPILQPWWPRIAALDAGFSHETAYYAACRLPNSQHLIYDEFVVERSSFVQIGYEVAKRNLDYLNSSPTHSLMVYCSPDAFHSRAGKDQKSIIELIALGISKVIGPDAVHIPDLHIRQLKESALQDNTQLSEEVVTRLRTQRRMGITLRIANDDRVIGWSYCREALRWTKIGDDIPPFDPDLANYLLINSPDQYEVYTEIYRHQRPEILPKLQILSTCSRLIDAIPKAKHYPLDANKSPEDVDKTHFRGMDSLDAWRYLEMGIEDSFPEEPFEVFRDRRLDQIISTRPDATTRDLVLANLTLEQEWKGKASDIAIFNSPRKSRPSRHRAYINSLRPSQ